MCQFINFVIVTNALLQNNETAEIGFIGRSPNDIAVVKIRIYKLRNSRAYVKTIQEERSCIQILYRYFFHWVGQPASVKGVLSPSEANAAFCAKRKTSANREKTEVVDYQNQTATPFVQFLYVWCIELSNTCTWRGSNVIEETIFLNKLWSGQFDCIFDRPYHGFGSHLDEQATA